MVNYIPSHLQSFHPAVTHVISAQFCWPKLKLSGPIKLLGASKGDTSPPYALSQKYRGCLP